MIYGFTRQLIRKNSQVSLAKSQIIWIVIHLDHSEIIIIRRGSPDDLGFCKKKVFFIHPTKHATNHDICHILPQPSFFVKYSICIHSGCWYWGLHWDYIRIKYDHPLIIHFPDDLRCLIHPKMDYIGSKAG